MSQVIIVSGAVCTGKTTLAKALSAELGYTYIDGNEIIKDFNLSEGFDKEMDCQIIDEKKFADKVLEVIEKGSGGFVVDSHMSHYISSEKVNKCIITKCDLKVQKLRLQDRGYNDLKINENLEAGIMDSCFNDAVDEGHKPIVINTTQGFNIKSIVKEMRVM